jgi:hypothetical protein
MIKLKSLGALENQDKQIHIRYMEMSGKDNEKLQKTVTPP